MAYTEQELEGLTEAEIQALRELEEDEAENARRHAEGDTDDRQNVKEAAAQAKEPPVDEEPVEDPPIDDDVPDDDPLPTEAPTPAPTPAPTEAPKAEDKPKPLFDVQPVEELDTKIADIKAQKKSLADKLEEGDIAFGEYTAEMEKLNDSELDLREARAAAKLNESNIQQQQKDAWQTACDSFLGANKEYDAYPGRFKLLNEAVIALANDPANAHLEGQSLLQKAHEKVYADLGLQAPAPTAKAKTNKEPLPTLPGLRQIPAAEANDTNESRFGYLDRLAAKGGQAYEDALSKLSDADRTAYLNQE